MIDKEILSGNKLLTYLQENHNEIQQEAEELVLMALKDLAEEEEIAAPRCAAITLEWRSEIDGLDVDSVRVLRKHECCMMHEFEVVVGPGGGLLNGQAALAELRAYIDEKIDELRDSLTDG
jgi:hypothetical protein